MVAFHNWLFEEALYKQESVLFHLDPSTHRRAGQALERFQRAWRLKRLYAAGSKIRITELRAQQAFNQLVFIEMLGFSDLFCGGPGYSVLPEVSFASPIDDERTSRPRSDLVIGDFTPSSASISGVTELKSPGADLTAPQRGEQYRSRLTNRQLSAVDQAIEAMTAASCGWAVISNLREICLIHKSNPGHALRFDLTTLDDQQGLRDFYFAFGPGGFHPVDRRTPRLMLIHDRVGRLSS